MSIISVTDSAFQEKILDAKGPVLVDFWAEWCGPCKQLAPVLKQVSDEMGDGLTIAKVNIDENPNSPTSYGVRSIPTLLLFKGGEVAAMKVGNCSKSDLEKWIRDNS